MYGGSEDAAKTSAKAGGRTRAAQPQKVFAECRDLFPFERKTSF